MAFGRGVGPTPDRFLVGLAVLSLMAAAATRPTPALSRRRCAVARPSVGADTGFRRAAADGRAGRAGLRGTRWRRRGVGRAAGTGDQRPVRRRRPGPAGLSRYWGGSTRGCETASSQRRVAFRWPCSRCHETSPRRSWPADSGISGARRSAGQIEDGFVHRIQSLPAPTQRLLLVAAAEPVGDAALFLRAAAQLGIAGRRAGACRSRRSDRVRSTHALSPPVDALGRLPRRRSDRPQGHSSGVGRCNRSAVRPGPSGMARRQRRGGTRRCGGRGAGNLSRPGAEQGRHRRGGSLPGARDGADIGPGPTWCQGARGRTGQTRCGRARRRRTSSSR